MEKVRIDRVDEIRWTDRTVVCLGQFDGVHIGHAALLREAVRVAQGKGFVPVMHTFHTLPVRVLHPERNVRELTQLEKKAELAGEIGIRRVAVSEFNDETMHMRAQDFFDHILVERLNAKHLVIGFHHRFGFMGEADAEFLSHMCEKAGLTLSVVPPVKLPDGTLVSSTAIRALIDGGEYERASMMLGRPVETIL